MRNLTFLALSASLAAQLPLPPQPVPSQNPVTPAKAILGKLLFWEEQMSTDNRVACGTCHTFAAGGGDLRRVRNPGPDGQNGTGDDSFASPGVSRSDANNNYIPDATFGFSPQVTRRSSPSFLTAAWFTDLFWDGRARSTFVDPDTGATLIPVGGALESQSLDPIVAANEMAHDARTFAQATAKLTDVKPMALAANLPADMAAAIAGGESYGDLFSAAFGTADITAARIAFALATYQRTLVPDQTPYDAFVAGNQGALTQQQRRGLMAFQGPARCSICHTTGLFSDNQFHNMGLRPISEDNGRQSVTGSPGDAGRFKTPSLRNVGLRNSFFHNGEFTTLPQVIGFYLNGGGPFNQNKDPQLVPVNFPPPVANDIVNFLTNGLTDPRVAQGLPPFDRPTLRGEVLPQNGSQSGVPTVGTAGSLPLIMAGVPGNLGNIDFKVGVFNALGGTPATLVISPSQGSSVISGVRINVSIAGGELYVPWVLNGAAGVPRAGYGTLRLALPDLPALAGLSLWTQWFVWDGGGSAAASASLAGRIDLF